MTKEPKRKNLGRGLDALLGEDNVLKLRAGPNGNSSVGRSVTNAPIEALVPGDGQPRNKFDTNELMGLAHSIKENGIIQPILVRKNSTGNAKWEIIAGERRWRAAQIAQMHEVPILIRELTDSEALEVALVENLQRENLSPLEEAEGYKRLINEYAHTQEALSNLLGKSRSHVANMIRLLTLPKLIKELLDSGNLSSGHARALLNANNPEKLAKIVVKRGLNVRQTEVLAKNFGVKSRTRPNKLQKDADTLALERDISESLGLTVSIQFSSPGGRLIIAYNTLEQLDDIILRLKNDDLAINPRASQTLATDAVSVLTKTPDGGIFKGSTAQSGELDTAIKELEAGARILDEKAGIENEDGFNLDFKLSDQELKQLISDE